MSPLENAVGKLVGGRRAPKKPLPQGEMVIWGDGRECVKIPLTHGLFTLVDVEDAGELLKVRWHAEIRSGNFNGIEQRIFEQRFVCEYFWPGEFGPGGYEIPPFTLDWLWECEEKLPDKTTQDAYCVKLAEITNGLVDWTLERMKVVAWKTVRASKEQRLAALVETIKGMQ